MVLNASEGRGTLTGRFVSAFAGAAGSRARHTEYWRPAHELEILHAPLLPMPTNYMMTFRRDGRWRRNASELRKHGALRPR